MSQVPVEPLLSQHCNECGQQRDQETCVHQARDRDNIIGWVLLDVRNSWSFTRDCRVIEGEEDGAEEGRRLVVGVGLEFRLDIDDEGRADGREQTGL